MTLARMFPRHPCLERLEALIAARVAPGADKAAIDRQLWTEFGDTAAVMFTDLSGFSRGVASFGIIHFLQVIREAARLHIPCIDRHGGRLLKSEGDSLLAVFATPVAALAAAVAMQRASHAYNQGTPPEEQVLLCVGLGYGPVLRIGDADVFGAEVNAASKLGEDTARAHEILATAAFCAALGEAEAVTFTRIDVQPPGSSGAFALDYARWPD